LRLALLGDRCDESAQCLSGYCRSEGGSSVAGPSIGVCDFPPAPVVGDLSAAFSGRGGKHSLVLLGGALAVVLLLLTVVYGALMMAKLVRQKKRQSSRSTAATGAVDVYVPMRIVSYSTAAGRPDSAGISEGEEEEGEEDFETSQPSGCPPPYKLVSENETDEDYSSDDDKHTTVVAGSSSGSGNNNTSGDDTANLATLDRKIQLN
jgi:hypothetical protein